MKIKLQALSAHLVVLLALTGCQQPTSPPEAAEPSPRPVEPAVADASPSTLTEEEPVAAVVAEPPSVPAVKKQAPPAAPEEPEAEPTKMFVVADTVDVHVRPAAQETVTNRLLRGQVVTSYETKNGWSRVSTPYPGANEGLDEPSVARWVPADSLSTTEPAPLPEVEVAPADPRINGLPKVQKGAATLRDVQILEAAARYFLDEKGEKRVEYGDVSGSKPGTYYLNFGGNQNHFFRPSDIPNLEQRILDLGG